MKKLKVCGAMLLTTLMMLSVLTACDSGKSKERSKRHKDDDEKEEEEDETEDTEETEPIPTFTEASGEPMYVEETTETTDDQFVSFDDGNMPVDSAVMTMYYGAGDGSTTEAYDTVHLYSNCYFAYPDLQDSLNEINEFNDTDTFQELEYMMAEEYKFGEYKRNISVVRSDSVLFSLVVSEDYMLYNDVSDAVHYSKATGYTFDVKTGNRLSVDDLLDESKDYDWEADLASKIDMDETQLETLISEGNITFACGCTGIYAVRNNIEDSSFTMSMFDYNYDDNESYFMDEYLVNGDYIEDISWCFDNEYETPTYVAFFNDPKTGKKVDINIYAELADGAMTPNDTVRFNILMNVDDNVTSASIDAQLIDDIRLAYINDEYYVYVLGNMMDTLVTYVFRYDPKTGVVHEGEFQGLLRGMPIYLKDLDMDCTAEPVRVEDVNVERYEDLFGGSAIVQRAEIIGGKPSIKSDLMSVIAYNKLILTDDVEATDLLSNEKVTLSKGTELKPLYINRDCIDFVIDQGTDNESYCSIAIVKGKDGYVYDGKSVDEIIAITK